MLGGDLSNEFAPTLVFDVDGLIISERKIAFGLATETELNPSSIKVCEHHILNGRMIYLLAHGRNKSQFHSLQALLDDWDFPYTKMFAIATHEQREAILGRNHVHTYYYFHPHHAATSNKRKEKKIINVAESYF
jgi:hypothetical protein